jgi:alkyldihydroxyacetonephosphate synthase
VAALLAWANETHHPIVPFGGGSGVCEAIVPDGAVVLDTARLQTIFELDEKSRLVRCGAGTTGPQLAEYLDERGFFLGHAPQSLSISTVGGWVATRACGQLSTRYGGIEDLVAGFEAVLATGQVVRSKTVPRRSVGPDVASLLIGSEGTLGVITEATLRIVPIPTEHTDVALSFQHMGEGVATCRSIAQSDLGPVLMRLYDREDTGIFFMGRDGAPAGPILLLSFEGRDHDGRARDALDISGGERADPRWVELWWDHRNDAVDSYRDLLSGRGVLGPHALVDTMEVSGTWSALRDLYHLMKETLAVETDIVGCHLSHAYPDGACLYFTLAAACRDEDDAVERHFRWWEAGMSACLVAGGSISHHHGIGRLKARRLPEELGGWWDALVAVKRALDPNGILNPGALGL